MSKYISDGIIQLHYIATDDLADPSQPTLAEITGDGVDLTGFMRSLDTPLEGSTVDAATADSAYNSTVAGTYGGQPVSGEFVRDSVAANDTAWNTLPFRTQGYFIVARRGGTGTDGALAVGDLVDVFPIDVSSRNPVPYGRNELARFMMNAAVPTLPEFDVPIVLVASA